MRRIYESAILTLLVSLPAFSFTSLELYSYYFQPLEMLENVPAELVVIKNNRGVRYELGMIVYLNGKSNTAGFIVERANSLDVIKNTVYGNYMDKKFLVNLTYKEGVFKSFPFVSTVIPIDIHNKNITFLDGKDSKDLFFYKLYDVLWFLFSIVFAFILVRYLSFKYPRKLI